MDYNIHYLEPGDYPPLLKEIPEPPQTLNYRGILPTPGLKLLAVVGSRQYSSYGKQAVDYLLSGLKGYPVGVVSGLALGIDSLAHQVALNNGLYTLAIPGSGLNDGVIYPASQKPLARKILENGGGLLSEYDQDFTATTWSFPRRNRLVCGIAQATLVIEAKERSGSLITARLTVDYNRELLVVPGSIFSANQKGTHQFLKLGATPVTESEDILTVLGLESATQETVDISGLSEIAILALSLLDEPLPKDILVQKLGLKINEANILLTQLEMLGHLKEQNGTLYRI